MVPEDISDAIARGDRQAVKAWLNAEDSDVNALSVYGQSPLGTCMLAAAQSQSKYEARNHLEVAHMLVARGARAGGASCCSSTSLSLVASRRTSV